jgi:predicted RNA-binding protein with PUA-like domain
MAYWLIKSDPEEYGFDKLTADGKAVWDGVSNPLALQHMRNMRKGEKILVYHTGEERRIVGIAETTGNPYPDPKKKDGKLVVIDIKPLQALEKPVTLDAIKADPSMADFELVRLGRLSVMPVSHDRWDTLLAMGT